MRDIIAIAAILFSAHAIRKTAREARVSFAHQEMCKLLPKTVEILGRSLTLLDHVAQNVIYRKLPKREVIEKAYDRYWKEAESLSVEYGKISESNRLFLHADLYFDLKQLLVQLGKGMDLVSNLHLNEDGKYEDTKELRNLVEQAGKTFREFVAKSRRYIGADELYEISDFQSDSLGRPSLGKEESQP